ncbi:MAG: CaiB/BaiF CoA transferase family protein [bacterium]
MSGPLQGVRVLDLSRYISGPYCSMLLGDLGAEVIKIEKPVVGEESRTMGPYAGDVSLYFTQYNKNKRSVTLNLRSVPGQEILRGLIQQSDVLVENFRPGTLDAMGLTQKVLDELNPELVVTSISGFGQDGPYRDRVAFDCIAQAMSGLMSLTGEEDGTPLLTGTWVVDFVSAIYAALGTVSALYSRRNTGEGQRIDVSLLDCISSLLATTVPLYTTSGIVEKRWKNRDKVTAPANAFKTRDGYIYIHAGTQPLFSRIVKIIGQPELIDDPRFDTVSHRMENIEAVEEAVQKWAQELTTAEIDSLLSKSGIPVAPISDIPGVVNNPQIQHRKVFEYMDYPGAGKISINGITLKMSKTPGKIELRPPLLGEHNDEVYNGLLGLKADEIQRLQEQGVI